MYKGKKLAIVTCCQDDWGGSEELWARSLSFLNKSKFENITIFKNKVNLHHPEFKKLEKDKLLFKELDPKMEGVQHLITKLSDIARRFGVRLGLRAYYWNKSALRLYKLLKKSKPHLVVISQGVNFDGLIYANQCLMLNIPYIIVAHKAVSFYWPNSEERPYMKKTLLNAKHCLFVSKHNKILTEEQFGMRLDNGSIILNPVKTAVKPLPYPDTASGFKLACVGRLFVIDKGQDILLRILAQEKWRKRNISVTFYGNGPDKDGLKEMAALLEVSNVTFSEFKTDIHDIWAINHALILPSRSEGLPLTVIEAMSLGRMIIATNAGGTNEIVQDQVTGFIGDAFEKDFENTMEKAWVNRHNWESMGKDAAAFIRANIPQNPEKEFANVIMKTLNEQ